MTLAELQSLDFVRLWAGLSDDAKAAIGVPVITQYLAEMVQYDDGTDCSEADQDDGADMAQSALEAIEPAVDAAFPELRRMDPEAFGPAWGDDAHRAMDARGKVLVNGCSGRRRLWKHDCRWFVRVGGVEVRVGGFREIVRADAPSEFVAWTVDQIEAVRQRRHPKAEGLSWR